MLNEFYKYIANNTIGFFQSHQSAIRPGERYCLRLDTEEMVASVDQALRQKALVDGSRAIISMEMCIILSQSSCLLPQKLLSHPKLMA